MANNKVKNLIKSNRVFPQTLIISYEEIDSDFVNMIVNINIGLHEENITSNESKVLPQNKVKNPIKSNRVFEQTLIIPDKEIDSDLVNMIVNLNIGLHEQNITINQNKRSPILPKIKVRNEIKSNKLLPKNLIIPD